MQLGTLPENLEGIDMNSLVEQVLHFRSSKYVEDLCFALLDEGIAKPSDILRVSKETLETKLRTHANFEFQYMADVQSLRSAIDPKPAKDAKQNGNDRKGGTRLPPRGERGRSRSPARGRKNGRDNSGGRGGQRHNSRLHKGQKKGNDNGNNNRNKEEKVKPELWAAVAQGDAAKVHDLLLQGKDPAETFEGWSPLMKASEEDNEEIMRMLLDMKVDVEAANKKGRTALSFAAAPSNDGSTPRPTAVAAIRLLLQSGAVDKKDMTGVTAKDRAAREKRKDAVAVFEEFGHDREFEEFAVAVFELNEA